MNLRSVTLFVVFAIALGSITPWTTDVRAQEGPLLSFAAKGDRVPNTIAGDSNSATRLDSSTTPASIISKLPNVRPLSDLINTSTPPTAPGTSAAEYYILNFEDNWTDPNNEFWLHQDTSGADGGEYFWGKRDCFAFDGEFSALTAGGGAKGQSRSCTSKYPKNARSDALHGFLNLQAYQSGSVTIYFKGESEGFSTQACEATNDYFFFGLGPESPDNVLGRRHCGPFSDGTYFSTIDLTTLQNKVLGTNRVLFELFFYSDDDSLQGPGFSIDHVVFELFRTPAPAPITKVYVPMSRKYTAPAVKGCPDNEPNSVKTQGSVITQFGVACKGTLPPGDASDFYAVDVSANRKLIVDLNNFGKNDYDVYLYNAGSDTPIAQSALNPGLPEHLEFTSSSSQRLYIWVVARDPYISPYSYYLTVKR